MEKIRDRPAKTTARTEVKSKITKGAKREVIKTWLKARKRSQACKPEKCFKRKMFDT